AVIVLLVPGALAVIVSLPLFVVGVVISLSRLSIEPRADDVLTVLGLAALGATALAGAVLVLRRLSFWALIGSPGGAALEAISGSASLPKRFAKQGRGGSG